MELPSPPDHGDTVWFFIIARNAAAKSALSLTKRRYEGCVGLKVLDEGIGHSEIEQGFGWLAVPRKPWQSAGFHVDRYNVLTFGFGDENDVILQKPPGFVGAPQLQARIIVTHRDGNNTLILRDESCCQTTFMLRRDASEEMYDFTPDDLGRQRVLKERGVTYVSIGGAHFTISFEELSDDKEWWYAYARSKEAVIARAELATTRIEKVFRSWSHDFRRRRNPPRIIPKATCKQHEQARTQIYQQWQHWITPKRNTVTRGPRDRVAGETDPYVSMLRHAGEGATGIVKLVMNARTGLMMARKVIKQEDSHENRKTAAKESETLASLTKLGASSHDKNIIRFYAFFPVDSHFHIYMAPAAGNLRDVLTKKREANHVLSVEDAADLAGQMLNALQYLHETAKFLHRDIKPENILVLHPPASDLPQKYLLADFGLTTRANYVAQTKCGTLKYVAPEVANLSELQRFRKLGASRTQTSAVDIWSLGVTLLETRQHGAFCGPKSWENGDLKKWCTFLEFQTRSSALTPLLTCDHSRRSSARQLIEILDLLDGEFEGMRADYDSQTFERYIADTNGLPYDAEKTLQRSRDKVKTESMSCSYGGTTSSRKRRMNDSAQDVSMKKSRTSSKLSPPSLRKNMSKSRHSRSALTASEMSISSAATLVGEEEDKEHTQMVLSYGGTAYC